MSRKVLIVDDEPMIRTLVRAMLEKSTFSVVEAGEAGEALQLLSDDPGVDVIVADVMIPGMTGVELVKQIVSRRPRVGVLFISAYPYHPDFFRVEEKFPFLRKPFSQDELVRAVEGAISARPAS